MNNYEKRQGGGILTRCRVTQIITNKTFSRVEIKLHVKKIHLCSGFLEGGGRRKM